MHMNLRHRCPAGTVAVSSNSGKVPVRNVMRAAAGNGQSIEGNTTVHKLIRENGLLLLPGGSQYCTCT